MSYFKYACFFILFIAGQAYANDEVLLKKIDKHEFDTLSLKTKSNIASDANKSFPAHFDEDQSFKIISNGITQFKLVPVTFNSKKAKNDVCVLSVFSNHNQLLESLPLHYVEGDGDEIVESCIGVQAVASELRGNTHLLIYLLRYRSGNNYGDTVFIASVNSGKINKEEALSECVSNKKHISSVAKIRKAIKQCRTILK